jgi:hypothetical protein
MLLDPLLSPSEVKFKEGPPPSGIKRVLRKHDYCAIEQRLKDAWASETFPPLSLASLCKELRSDVGYISKRFPQLARSISVRYRNYRSTATQVRLKNTALEVRKAVKTLHEGGKYPSTTKVSSILQSGVTLRDPFATQARKAAMRELGISERECTRQDIL